MRDRRGDAGQTKQPPMNRNNGANGGSIVRAKFQFRLTTNPTTNPCALHARYAIFDRVILLVNAPMQAANRKSSSGECM
jgi:hypothetical protein